MTKHKDKKKKKTIMKEFSIHEISVVDHPAQAGASMVIMKRREPGTFAKAIALVRAEDPEWVERVIKDAHSFDDILAQQQAQALAGEAMSELFDKMAVLHQSFNSILEDDTLTAAAMAKAIKTSVTEFLKAIGPEMTEAVGKTAKQTTDPALSGVFHAGTPGSNKAKKGNDPMADKDMTKELGDLKAQVEALTKTAKDTETVLAVEKKRAEAAESLIGLSDAEKVFHAKLDDADKESFVGKSAAERTLQIKRASEGDEVLEVHGQRIVKSEVGAAVFGVLKAQSAEMRETTKRLDEERDANQLLGLTKRAETEFDMLPGEPVAKAKALLAINKVEGDELATIETMLKAGNAAMAALAKQKGSDVLVDGSPEDKLEILAKSHAKAHDVDFHVAYAKVLESPEGIEIYNETIKN